VERERGDSGEEYQGDDGGKKERESDEGAVVERVVGVDKVGQVGGYAEKGGGEGQDWGRGGHFTEYY
jgi:hypothetical protein